MSGLPFDPDDCLHTSSYPCRGRLWAFSKPRQRALLRRGRDRCPVLVYILAAVQVQRYWRGVLLRRRVLQHYLHGGFTRRWRRDEAILRDAYRLVPRAHERELSALVTAVQARWRTTLLRHEFLRWSAYDSWPIYYVAAATIQRAWVDFRYVTKQRAHRYRSRRMYASREHAMAGRIQLAWRGYVNRQIFAFYKHLVQYREGSDALLMLRSINASEAFLMDPAAGLHVRFRLGGAAFPPIVLYKVFTHRSVADIGAFAPKDYVGAPPRRTAKEANNASDLRRTANGLRQLPAKPKDRSGWYQRVENNDWRAVSEAVFTGPNAAANLPDDVKTVWEQRYARYLDFGQQRKQQRASPAASAAIVSWRQRPAPKKFYALAATRRQKREERAKETKRRWLVELYSAEQEQQSRQPRESIREDAMALFATLGDEEVEEETKRLAEWTEHLDYDSYYDSWLRAATTAPTDAIVTVGSPSNAPTLGAR
jgi:hypothetical protein